MTEDTKNKLVIAAIFFALILLAIGGILYGKSVSDSRRAELVKRPLTSQERMNAIIEISRSFEYEFTSADFEGVSDYDIRIFLRQDSCPKDSCDCLPRCVEQKIISKKEAGYIVGKRMFFAVNDIYAVNMWEVTNLFLPAVQKYLTRQYEGYARYDSPEEISKYLSISLADAKKIWDKARSK
jgi:hypothetical protein